MKNPKSFRSLCALAAALLVGAATLAQEPPRLLPFQGRLTDPAGNAVSNGVRLVQFRIYGVPAGGAPVWAGEIHRTTVNGGLINVVLGTKTPLATVDFTQPLYLEITVDVNGDNSITAADPPMLPRQSIIPAPMAREAGNAAKLGGRDWTAILATGADPANPTNFIRGDKIQPASLSADQLMQDVIDRLVPPGTIVAFGGDTPPPGWLLCDGSYYLTNSYPRLYAAIGKHWGGYDQAYALPMLLGVFLRGAQAGYGYDPDAQSRVNQLPGGTNYGVGSFQYSATKFPNNPFFTGANGSHRHREGLNGEGVGAQVFAQFGWWGTSNYRYTQSNIGGGVYPYTDFDGQHTHSIGGGDNESRPVNAAVTYIIKY